MNKDSLGEEVRHHNIKKKLDALWQSTNPNSYIPDEFIRNICQIVVLRDVLIADLRHYIEDLNYEK